MLGLSGKEENSENQSSSKKGVRSDETNVESGVLKKLQQLAQEI
jgi:hypothetical protein